MLAYFGNALRGVLIGLAEVVPGLSGGTVALILGVYERLLAAGTAMISTVVRRDPDGPGLARALRGLDWGLLLPLGVGMVAALAAGAALIEPLFEHHPQELRGLFAGMVGAGLVVPARLVGSRWTRRDLGIAAVAAALAFMLVALPPGNIPDPHWYQIVGSGAAAVCALVLPGVSGSFLLLSLGLYATTIAAVNDRDLGYVGLFAMGALAGLALFVPFLERQLERHHRVTLATMTGLMFGSLRALWPWQTADRDLLAPSGAVGAVALWTIVGAGLVLAMILVESRSAATGPDATIPAPGRG